MSNNPFHMFDLPVRHNVDLAVLDERYIQLQKITHPDRFITMGVKDQLEAVKKAAAVNQAYQMLKNPVHRAAAVLACQGIEIPGHEGKTIQDPDILTLSLFFQERVEEADTKQELQKISEELENDFSACCKAFDACQDKQKLCFLYLQMLYLQKILDQIKMKNFKNDNK